MLECCEISKLYGKNLALKDFTYSFRNGIYALLGPNGAGKSTLMNILVGNTKMTGGDCFYNDQSISKMPKSYRNDITFLPQDLDGYPNFTVLEHMYYIGSLKVMKNETLIKQSEYLLKRLDLLKDKNKKISQLSGGMKQRLLICATLLNFPKIIILDEPTANLDPMQRIMVRNLLSEIKKDRIIIISTHIVSDIEYIADEVIFLKEGNMVLQGKVSQLINETRKYLYTKVIGEDALDDYLNKYKISSITRKNDMLELKIIGDSYSEEYCDANLDDVYLQAMV